jgi:hypothetical protein
VPCQGTSCTRDITDRRPAPAGATGGGGNEEQTNHTSPTAARYNPVLTAWQHITDEDLERYYLGMIKDEAELAPLEEHLLACAACVERAEEVAAYVDTLRAALIAGNFDLG